MRWRRIEEKPTTSEPITAVVATRDDETDGELHIAGIYYWRNGRAWINEASGKVLPETGPYWWMPEVELLRDLVRSGVTT